MREEEFEMLMDVIETKIEAMIEDTFDDAEPHQAEHYRGVYSRIKQEFIDVFIFGDTPDEIAEAEHDRDEREIKLLAQKLYPDVFKSVSGKSRNARRAAQYGRDDAFREARILFAENKG